MVAKQARTLPTQQLQHSSRTGEGSSRIPTMVRHSGPASPTARRQPPASSSDFVKAREAGILREKQEASEAAKHTNVLFIKAIMNAVASYSSKMRMPALCTSRRVPSSKVTAPSKPADVPPCVLSDDSSDEDGEEDEGLRHDSSSTELPPDLSKLLYTPSGSWAPFSSQPIENPQIIARLSSGLMCDAYIKQGILGGRKITYISKTWALSQAWEGFYSELALYSDPKYIRSLQGDIVPAIIGIYLIEGRISIAMELPHSSFWMEATHDMPDKLKRKCMAAFDMIHARGILHNDVELRHILINGNGGVQLIDFQMSRALNPKPELQVKACSEADIRMEKRQVRYKLNYGDSVVNENTKRQRVLDRRARNAKRVEKLEAQARGEYDGEVSALEEDDEDDIVNPIVDPGIWQDQWLPNNCEPVCYVVPGQDFYAVQRNLRSFAAKAYDIPPQQPGRRPPSSQKKPAQQRQATNVANPAGAEERQADPGQGRTAGTPDSGYQSGSSDTSVPSSSRQRAPRTAEHQPTVVPPNDGEPSGTSLGRSPSLIPGPLVRTDDTTIAPALQNVSSATQSQARLPSRAKRPLDDDSDSADRVDVVARKKLRTPGPASTSRSNGASGSQQPPSQRSQAPHLPARRRLGTYPRPLSNSGRNAAPWQRVPCSVPTIDILRSPSPAMTASSLRHEISSTEDDMDIVEEVMGEATTSQPANTSFSPLSVGIGFLQKIGTWLVSL